MAILCDLLSDAKDCSANFSLVRVGCNLTMHHAASSATLKIAVHEVHAP